MLGNHDTVTIPGKDWDRVHYAGATFTPGAWVLSCSGRTVTNATPGTGPRDGRAVWCGNCVKRWGLPGQISEGMAKRFGTDVHCFERRGER
jgi:hypothetical protein